MDIDLARDKMVSQQLRTYEVLDRRVLDLFERLQREDFVPSAYRTMACADMQIPLADGQMMMTPIVEGRLLQALGLQGDERVLEIGTGSGFLTACLASLARSVVSLDIREDLLAGADAALRDAGISNVVLQAQDAFSLSSPDAYDVVVVSGALPRLHRPFLEALRPGGCAFLIVGEAPVMEARLYHRCDVDQWSQESLFESVIPMLDGAPGATGFVF